MEACRAEAAAAFDRAAAEEDEAALELDVLVEEELDLFIGGAFNCCIRLEPDFDMDCPEEDEPEAEEGLLSPPAVKADCGEDPFRPLNLSRTVFKLFLFTV